MDCFNFENSKEDVGNRAQKAGHGMATLPKPLSAKTVLMLSIKERNMPLLTKKISIALT